MKTATAIGSSQRLLSARFSGLSIEPIQISWSESLSLSLSLFQKFQHFVCHIKIEYDFMSGLKHAVDQRRLLLAPSRLETRCSMLEPRELRVESLPLVLFLLACCSCLILFQVYICCLQCVDVSYFPQRRQCRPQATWLRALLKCRCVKCVTFHNSHIACVVFESCSSTAVKYCVNSKYTHTHTYTYL